MTVLLNAALSYAQRGWHVVPTWNLEADGSCTCQLGPQCNAAGKHPRIRGWVEAATTDPDQIRQWWTMWPDSNVSIVTGRKSGIFVIDIDIKGGGFDSLEEYERLSQYGLPKTLTATTGSGGRHLFYAYPPGATIGTGVGWLPGVDIRSDGGQVVAPPSPHKSGAFYTWTDGWNEGPANPPDELVAALQSGTKRDRSDLPSASDILAGVPEGQRNETLFRWACQLRRRLRDDRAAVEVLIREAGRRATPPMPDAEVDVIIDSAFKQDHDPMPDWAFANADDDGEDGLLPLTDDGNARRLTARYGKDLVWTAGGGWYTWDGRRWARDELLAVQTSARSTARSILTEELPTVAGSDAEKGVERWAQASQSAARIDAMIKLARDHLARRTSEFDSKPWLLNVANGTVDLHAERLLPFDRDNLLTRLSPAKWEEGATCPTWDEFMMRIMPEQEEREYLQRAVGYTLTGSTEAKALFILYGSGQNGKTVFLEGLRHALFGEYGHVAPKTLVMASFNEHPTELAGLAGARLVTLSEEVERRDRLRTGVLKSITGGEEMTARFMRQDFFTFQPEMKLWIATNHKPGMTDFGDAMTSRLKMVPFTQTIPKEEQRPRDELLRAFQAEAAGILNWAMAGLRAYKLIGLSDTQRMREEMDSWIDEDDLTQQFLNECCHAVGIDGSWTSGTEVYAAYERWVDGRGEGKSKLGLRSLSRELKSHHVGQTRRDGKLGWTLLLRNDAVAWQYATNI